ncbi:hypothetical protein [Neoaquamicrobium sediminum]|uniref:hypothetical protein n=1 Tax=Neoaquamicrobium sediminum TaxID=1849104 RepID=UPI00156748CB|nr:hypothetical protein [Mesorhizobium sediminum]NRC57394.1 hypothetical protein [Mesorhizobium sediminum]
MISNTPPNGPLAARLAAGDWPADVRVDWPAANLDARILPVPQASLLDAAEAASEMARVLPFATLAPQTLVWKLAGLVSLAATGDDPALDHVFKAGDLPPLFEQLVVQLQDLPLPPSPYRVQENEPDLLTGERVRLVVGYSGAGKTSWLAQSAQHSPAIWSISTSPTHPARPSPMPSLAKSPLAYFVRGTNWEKSLCPARPGERFFSSFPGAWQSKGEIVTVALDNVHQLSADDVTGVIQAGRDIRFVLLGRPEGEIPCSRGAARRHPRLLARMGPRYGGGRCG